MSKFAPNGIEYCIPGFIASVNIPQQWNRHSGTPGTGVPEMGYHISIVLFAIAFLKAVDFSHRNFAVRIKTLNVYPVRVIYDSVKDSIGQRTVSSSALIIPIWLVILGTENGRWFFRLLWRSSRISFCSSGVGFIKSHSSIISNIGEYSRAATPQIQRTGDFYFVG